MEDAHADPTFEALDNQIDPFYYFLIALGVLHLVVSSSLFVQRRTKFPVCGHNLKLSLFSAGAMSVALVVDAVGGLYDADSCTVASCAVYLLAISALNVVAASSVRLWFEYNLADEQAKTLRADVGKALPSGWFATNRKYFHSSRLVSYAIGLSLVECAIVAGAVASLMADVGFATLLPCENLIVALALLVVFATIVASIFGFVFWRFRGKRDGYGIRNTFKWWAVIFAVTMPPNILIDFWEALDDLDYYVEALGSVIRFIGGHLFVVALLDVPLYRSYADNRHGGMSSISQVHDDDEEDVDEYVQQVMGLAEEAALNSADTNVGPGDIELQTVASEQSPTDEHEPQRRVESAASHSPAGATHEAPKVFSSNTLTLSLEDVLLNPVYSKHLESFTKHLVGEFSVENLLFFYRVLNFQRFATSGGVLNNDLSTPSDSGCESFDHDVCNGGGGKVATRDFEKELAWRALLIFFEFFHATSYMQVNVSHRVSEPMLASLQGAIGGFKYLSPGVSRDDIELKGPVDAQVFDRAQHEVGLLLRRDPFVRWRAAIRDVITRGGES